MNEREPLSFPDWREALATVALSPAEREAYRREILAFLHLCKVRRAPATVMLAKEYLADRERQGAMEARPRLRWFFQAGRARLTAVARDPRPAPAGRAVTARVAAGQLVLRGGRRPGRGGLGARPGHRGPVGGFPVADGGDVSALGGAVRALPRAAFALCGGSGRRGGVPDGAGGGIARELLDATAGAQRPGVFPAGRTAPAAEIFERSFSPIDYKQGNAGSNGNHAGSD
jgi:hypothetical protein